VQADPASAGALFTQGLLDPTSPVPDEVRGGSARRFGVYRNNVTTSLVRAMESSFPVVRRLLGEDYFAGFTREFVQKHPPRSPLLFEYGAEFSAYLASATDLKGYPYLSDIARLEQQVRISYHEENADTLKATELTQISEDELIQTVFTPHPAAAILSSEYAIHAIYRANRSAQAESVDDIQKPQSILVTRPEFEVELNSLTTDQHEFFQSLINGSPFGDAADAAFDVNEDFDLTNAITLLLATGALQSLSKKNA
jgi:hypothetical protein